MENNPKLNFTTLLSKDLKKFKVKQLTDEELHQLLVNYNESDNEKEKIKYRNKIIEHLLPLLVSRCKNLGVDDHILASTDFINACVLEILNCAIDTFDISRQEKNRCSLFTHYVNYFINNAIKRLKRKFNLLPDQPEIYTLSELKDLNDPENDIPAFDITALADIEDDSFFTTQEELADKESLKHLLEEHLINFSPRTTTILVLLFGLRRLDKIDSNKVFAILGLSNRRASFIKVNALKTLRQALKEELDK